MTRSASAGRPDVLGEGVEGDGLDGEADDEADAESEGVAPPVVVTEAPPPGEHAASESASATTTAGRDVLILVPSFLPRTNADPRGSRLRGYRQFPAMLSELEIV